MAEEELIKVAEIQYECGCVFIQDEEGIHISYCDKHTKQIATPAWLFSTPSPDLDSPEVLKAVKDNICDLLFPNECCRFEGDKEPCTTLNCNPAKIAKAAIEAIKQVTKGE